MIYLDIKCIYLSNKWLEFFHESLSQNFSTCKWFLAENIFKSIPQKPDGPNISKNAFSFNSTRFSNSFLFVFNGLISSINVSIENA